MTKVVVEDSDIQIFRTWLKQQPFLPQDDEDHTLGYVIAASKGSIEVAKKKYDNYFKEQIRFLDIFPNTDPLSDEMMDYYRFVRVFKLPKKTPEGYTVIMTNFHNMAYSSLERFFYRHVSLVQTMLWDKDFGSCEIVAIFDFTEYVSGHAKDINPVILERVARATSSIIPRLKGFHVIGMSPLIGFLAKIALKCMSEKLRKRVFFHSKIEEVYDHVPKEIMPVEYGGKEVSMDKLDELAVADLRKYRKRFVAQREMRLAEEKLRPASPESEIMAGTFKQLIID